MDRPTPGPPLLAESEYCATAAPTVAEYARASALGLLASLGGGGIWYGTVLVTGRLWGILAVGMGLLCGLAVHYGATRHRSVALGVMAAGYSAVGLGLGYLLLFYPHLLAGLIETHPPMGRLRWFDLLFASAALFLAYRTAGPVRRTGGPF